MKQTLISQSIGFWSVPNLSWWLQPPSDHQDKHHDYGADYEDEKNIRLVVPLTSNSDQQDFYMFSRG